MLAARRELSNRLLEDFFRPQSAIMRLAISAEGDMDLMKSPWKVLPAVLVAVVVASTAQAQMMGAPPAPPWSTTKPGNPPNPQRAYDRHHEFANRFSQYLKNHPDVQADLTRDPKLVHDKAYMQAHPGLHQYLENHPGVAGEFHEDPVHFMGRVNHIYGGQ